MQIDFEQIYLLKVGDIVLDKLNKTTHNVVANYGTQKIIVLEDKGVEFHLTWETFQKKYEKDKGNDFRN